MRGALAQRGWGGEARLGRRDSSLPPGHQELRGGGH